MTFSDVTKALKPVYSRYITSENVAFYMDEERILLTIIYWDDKYDGVATVNFEIWVDDEGTLACFSDHDNDDCIFHSESVTATEFFRMINDYSREFASCVASTMLASVNSKLAKES